MQVLELHGLCKGMGNILGIFLRNSYFTQNSPWRIIGVQISDLNIFDTIPGTTDTVMDLVLKLSKMKFSFNPDAVTENQTVKKFSLTTGDIYSLQFLAASSITSDVFKGVLDIADFEEFIHVLNPNKCGLDITLYIKKVSGVSSEELSKMYINEIGALEGKILNSVVPVACSGIPNVNIFYKIQDKGPTEDLVFTFDGNDEDFKEFKRIIYEESIPAIKSLLN